MKQSSTSREVVPFDQSKVDPALSVSGLQDYILRDSILKI